MAPSHVRHSAPKYITRFQQEKQLPRPVSMYVIPVRQLAVNGTFSKPLHTVAVLQRLNNCISSCWQVKTWCTKHSDTSVRKNCPHCSKPFHLRTERDPIYKTLCCFWNITQWTRFRNCVVLRFHFTLLTTDYPSCHIILHQKTSISWIKLHKRLHLLTPGFCSI